MIIDGGTHIWYVSIVILILFVECRQVKFSLVIHYLHFGISVPR